MSSMSRQPRGWDSASLDAAVGDDEQRRCLFDAEALGQIWTFVHLDLDELERAVVLAALEHLRDEALDAPAAAAHSRVEEDEPRFCGRLLFGCNGNLAH